MANPHPRPTFLKILEGEKNKDRINLNEPQPKKMIPACPSHLTVEAKKEYKRLSQDLFKLGILTKIDMAAFAAYCQAYSRWSTAEKDLKKRGWTYKTQDGLIKPSPLIKVANDSMSLMLKFLQEFGMTPSSRTKLNMKILGDKVSEDDELLD